MPLSLQEQEELAPHLASLVPENFYSYPVSGFRARCSPEVEVALNNRLKMFTPDLNWRVISDLSGRYSKWSLAWKENDPREHYCPDTTGRCTHCGKSAEELGVPLRTDDD